MFQREIITSSQEQLNNGQHDDRQSEQNQQKGCSKGKSKQKPNIKRINTESFNFDKNN